MLTQLCTGRYGGGGVCLKEMLANADDVRAMHFTIFLDKSYYPTHSLLDDNMQDMQKPGLVTMLSSLSRTLSGTPGKLATASKRTTAALLASLAGAA